MGSGLGGRGRAALAAYPFDSHDRVKREDERQQWSFVLAKVVLGSDSYELFLGTRRVKQRYGVTA